MRTFTRTTRAHDGTRVRASNTHVGTVAKLRDSADDLFALVGAASEYLSVPQEFVEKDFWVTELLRSTARTVDDATVIFKGGTSLSKAFGLIERFSEDVDILVVPDQSFGKGRVHRILKHICERVGVDLDIAAEDQLDLGSEKGIHRNVRYIYPARSAPLIVREGVLLEMGCRGGDLPRERRELRSMITRYVIETGAARDDEYEEFASFDIDVLAPERTLVEKLALLHRLSVDDGGRELARSGRHLYDLFKLLSDGSILAKLRSDPALVARLAVDADAQSVKWELPVEPRPMNGYGDSPAFELTGSPARSLRQGLASAHPLIYGTVPTFEECIEVVRRAAELL